MNDANVLVIIDPDSAEHPCIARGVEFARRLDANLELYVCDVVRAVPERWVGALNTQQYGALLREQRVQLLEQLAQPLRARGLQVITNSDSRTSLEEGVLRHVVATKPIMVIDDELFSMLRGAHAAQQDSLEDKRLPPASDANRA